MNIAVAQLENLVTPLSHPQILPQAMTQCPGERYKMAFLRESRLD